MTKWVCLFSQTGSEIVELSEQLGRWPDVIISNVRPAHVRVVTAKLKDKPVTLISNKPTEDEYRKVLASVITPGEDYVITLHGWLRVVPESIIKEYPFMFNGHPGLITKYPQLKGKDPQMKAWDLKLETTGCVIHKVTAGVDEGPISREVEVSIKGLTVDQMFETLHANSVQLWAAFLKRHWL